jgi:phage-related protein
MVYKRSIKFYKLPNGQSPVEKFLDILTDKQAKKVTWVLNLIETMEMVSAQYFKKLVSTDDIWEIRVQFGSDDYRLLGFFDGGALVILTNGFPKKSLQTPAQEIALAEHRKNDYFARR